jgi:hypothetical protein
MLTGTPDAYYETAPFAGHLAGTVVRSKRSGQGWVRVPAATSITASVLVLAEKGSTVPPDSAVTDPRLPALRPDEMGQ